MTTTKRWIFSTMYDINVVIQVVIGAAFMLLYGEDVLRFICPKSFDLSQWTRLRIPLITTSWSTTLVFASLMKSYYVGLWERIWDTLVDVYEILIEPYHE